jgi:hypothetical protein
MGKLTRSRTCLLMIGGGGLSGIGEGPGNELLKPYDVSNVSIRLSVKPPHINLLFPHQPEV